MRMLCLLAFLAITGGCSALRVHCDSHLRPINPRQPALTRQQSATNAVATEQVRP
jgi:hypothetical protein